MKKWQSYTALKQVKNETENLTAALANALETVIVTPAGEQKSLDSLNEPVAGFTIIPGIMALLEFANIALLASEIIDLLQDTLAHPGLEPEALDARLQIAFVATTDLPALLEDALVQSADSFAKVFAVINQVRKTWDRSAVFDSRVLLAKQKQSFKKQFAATPDKVKDVLARQSSLFIKAGKALLDDNSNTRAVTALKGVAGNMEILFRDHRLGTLWGLAGGVIESFQDGGDEQAVKSVIALGKPLHLLSTGDLTQLDHVDDNVLGRMLEVVSTTTSRSLRLAIIRQWYGLDRHAARQMKLATRKLLVRYARKSALNNSLRLINEDINRLVEAINQMIESGQVSRDKVDEIYRGVFSLREVLGFLNLGDLARHIDDNLQPEPAEPLEEALSQAAGILFVISKEVVDKLESLEREVFSSADGLPDTGTLGAARLHVYLTAMKLLDTVITDIDTYVENGCRGDDLNQARDILDELSCVFILVSLPEQQQYLATARDYVNLVAHGVEETMPDASFNALSHLVINSLWYLEQLSIGREQDSRAYLEKSGRFAAVLQDFVDAHPAPDPGPGGGNAEDVAGQDADIVTESAGSGPDAPAVVMPANTQEAPAAMTPEAAAGAYGAEPEVPGREPVPVEEPHDVPDEDPVPVEEPEELPGEEPDPIEEPVPEPEPVEEPGETPPEAPPVTDSAAEEDGDDEIKAIFAEEFDEVLESLREELANLKSDFQQPAALKDCCRYFHTLKGSGRMVGAEIIGTLSFAMERLYDYLHEQQSTNAEVMELTERVMDTLPAMKASFMDPAAPVPEAALIRALCEEAVSHMSAEAAADIVMPVADTPAPDDVAQDSDAAADADIPVITDTVPTLSDAVDLSDETLLADAGEEETGTAEAETVPTSDAGRAAQAADAPDAAAITADDDDDFDFDFEIKEAPEEATRGLVIDPDKAEALAAAEAGKEEEIDFDFEIEEAPAAGTGDDDVDANLVSKELQDINDRLAAVLGGGEDSPDTSDLLVPLHTLYGVASVQKLENFADAVKAMETFVERHPRKSITADMALVFQDFCFLTDKQAKHLARGGTGEYATLAFEAIDLEKSLADLADSLDATTGSAGTAAAADADPVLAGFLREARDLIARLAQQHGDSAGMAHTLNLLSGAAEVADIEAVEKVAASMEAACQQGSDDDTLKALIDAGCRWLETVPELLESGNQPVDTDNLCERLLSALSGDTDDNAPVSASAEVLAEAKQAREPAPPATAAVTPALASEETVDQELLAIFLDEADEILEEIDGLYLRWQDGDDSVIDEFLRHLHTLKGSSALVLEKQLSQAAHDYETFIIDARNTDKGFDAAFFADCDRHMQGLLEIYRLYSRDAAGMIVRQAAAPETPAEPQDSEHTGLERPQTVEPETPGVTSPPPAVQQADSSADTAAPAPDSDEDPVDQDLLAIFLDEADEILEEIDSLYLRWQEGDESVIDEYLRHLHTLKGSSALVREMALSKAAHDFESFIIDARQANKGYDADFFTHCDRHMQGLQEIYKLYSRDESGFIKRAGEAPVAPKDSSTAAAEPTTAPAVADTLAVNPPGQAGAATAKAALQPPGTAAIQAAAEEQVRVSSQLLKNLMNDADEINFSRNRVEKSFNDISHLLADMDETLHKVRTYVKRFEDKARESYTTAVQENTEPTTGRISDEFDSLEMDRYTELHEMSLSLTEDYDDLQDIRMNLANRLKDIDNVLLGQQRLTNSLQDGLISSQMVSFSSIVPRLRRLVRQISRDLNKDVRFEVENQQGNLDKNVLQAIITPFEHIIRNALDHGIETPAQRREAGKPEQAVLAVRVTRLGASIVIEIRDDGRGINVDKVKSRAIERGLIDADAEISHAAACMLIFQPGFSTADAVSSISGRGVGLDVVKSEITQIGGTVEIDSALGEGTAFIIQLPLTTSLNRSLMFEVQGHRYVVLMNTLDGVKTDKLANILQQLQGNAAAEIEYGGKRYEYVYLGKMLNLDVQAKLESVDTSVPMLLVSGKDRNFALHIDKIIESRDLVVKSFSKQFATMPGIGGGVIMPDGNVAIVLDLVTLVNQFTSGTTDDSEIHALTARQKEEDRRRLVMVVDDSITVRKVTTSTLKRHGLEVITAKNGLEAIELLETQVPDVILLDIEMPKMDGFETATHIRKQEPPVRDIPIIMITSRIGDKHRTRAQEIGVNEFMSKPFVEDVLIEHIRSYQKNRST